MEREAAMKIGIPKEVKIMEERVAVTPAGVRQLTAHSHVVYIEKGAGRGSGIPDDQYAGAGASILDTADSVWAQSEMIFKVKEPVNEEFDRMKEEQILFTYLHLAADQQLNSRLGCQAVITRPGDYVVEIPKWNRNYVTEGKPLTLPG